MFNEEFDNLQINDLKKKSLHFENCIFKNMDWQQAYISRMVFEDCGFIDCNLSNAEVSNTALKMVKFEGCKLQGIPFDTCSKLLLELDFNKCKLDFSGFRELKLSNISFNECILAGVDFSNADLQKAHFNDCDLREANFYESNLTAAIFKNCVYLDLNLESKKIKKLQMDLFTAQSLLVNKGLIIK